MRMQRSSEAKAQRSRKTEIKAERRGSEREGETDEQNSARTPEQSLPSDIFDLQVIFLPLSLLCFNARCRGCCFLRCFSFFLCARHITARVQRGKRP